MTDKIKKRIRKHFSLICKLIYLEKMKAMSHDMLSRSVFSIRLITVFYLK